MIKNIKEEKRDQFLVNMGEEISKNKKFITAPVFKYDDKIIKEVNINGKKMKLSQVYADTINLRDCLKNGISEAIKNFDNQNSKTNRDKACFCSFKSYMKDIINLCYFDIELNEKHMDLIYAMINNLLMEANNEIINIENNYKTSKQNADNELHENIQAARESEMNDYLNSPTIISTNNVDSIWGNSTTVTGVASKLGKAPTGKVNPVLYDIHDSSLAIAESSTSFNYSMIIFELLDKFNNQLVNLMIEKKPDLFISGNFDNTDNWLEYISKSSEKELNNIYECVNCYNIDLKTAIENIVINNSVAGKEIDKNYPEFYKLINDSKEIDVGQKISDLLIKKIITKISKMDDLSEKDNLIAKETKKIDNIPYIKSEDKLTLVNNINKEIKKQENIINNEVSSYKKNKRNKLIIIILITLAVLIFVTCMIIFKEFAANVLMVAISLVAIYITYKIIKKIFWL